MTERVLQSRFWTRYGATFGLLLPNYTPRGWFECDLFGVTRAGYFQEFEIKLTVPDYWADFEKRGRLGSWRDGYREVEKHRALKAGDPAGPSAFWFCLSTQVAGRVEIPSWAGLRVFDGRWRTVKTAPRLHRTKCPQAIQDHARGVTYFRFWTERLENVRMRQAASDERAVS